jgi:hypothetical protein
MIRPLTCVMLSILIHSTAFAQDQQRPGALNISSSEVAGISDTVKQAFAPYHLAPIGVPEGERVGDIMDPENWTLIARADDCFPGLRPSNDWSVLPAILRLSEKGLAAALGASVGDNKAQAGGDAQAVATFQLEFSDVRVERVAQSQIRKALEKLKTRTPECERVRPFVITPSGSAQQNTARGKNVRSNNAGQSPSGETRGILADKPPPLVMGMVFYARRVVHVTTSEQMTGNAKVSLFEELKRRIGFGSSFEVKGNNNVSDTFDLIGQNSVPVAYAPAYVVTELKKAENGKVEYRVASVDPDVVQEAIRVASGGGPQYPDDELSRVFTQFLAKSHSFERPPEQVSRIEAARSVLGLGS